MFGFFLMLVYVNQNSLVNAEQIFIMSKVLLITKLFQFIF